MQYKTFSAPHITGGSITYSHDHIFVLKLSADVHTSYSTHYEALESIYPHFILAGAGGSSREDFLDAINKLGASIEISMHAGIVTFSIRAESQAAPQVLKLFETMLTKPNLADTELTRITRLLENELPTLEDDSRARATTEFYNQLFGVHDRRYGAAPKDVGKLYGKVTVAQVRELHERILGAHWTLTIGGSAGVSEQATKLVSRVKGKRVPTVALQAHEPNTPAVRTLTLHPIAGKQNIDFSIGGPLPLTVKHSDYVPFIFGLAVLGKWGGFTGRLMSTVREKEGLTYSIYARTESVSQHECGVWRIMTFFAPEKAVTGVTSTLREVEKIAARGITTAEHERFKTILTAQQTLLNDAPVSAVSSLHSFLMDGFTLDEMDAFKAALRTVDRTAVNRALKQYLDPHALVVSGAGPVETVAEELQTLISTTSH